jgi:outer membrane protein assembly factor BamE
MILIDRPSRPSGPATHSAPAGLWRRVSLPSLVIATASLGLLAGCTTRNQSTDSFLGFITPYRIDIVQGNAITKEQVAAVKPGMSREQVQNILGTPMLADPFRAERWDYPFSLRRPGTDVQRRTVVAFFNKAGTLDKLVAPDDLPDEAQFVGNIVPARKITPPTLELTEAQRQALPKPAPVKPDSTAAAPQGPARTYPPLEPK